MGRKILFFIVVVLVASGTRVLAQTDQDNPLAKKYYQLGEELYNRSDYEGALAQFKLAYRHSKKPALRYNMARCHEFMGQLKRAIEHYEAFLASNPPNAPVVRSRIANLHRKLAAEPDVKPEPAKPEPAKPEPARPEPVRPEPVRPEPVKPEPVKPEPIDKGGTLRLTGWILVGAGAASLITGIVMGKLASNRARELEDAASAHKPWTSFEEVQDSGQAFELAQIVTLAVGGAMAAGGAVLVYLGYRSKETRRAWIDPGITPGGAMVTGTFRF